MSDQLRMSIDAGVARLTLNRPEKRNALSAEMLADLIQRLAEAGRDEDVRVLIVAGEGGSFCAGADLAEVREEDGTESTAYRELVEAGISAMRDFPRPTVAVITGACIGAGMILALACDVRFAAPDAALAVPVVRYGFEMESHGLSRLVELMGSGQAIRFLLSAARLTGSESAGLGLVEVCAEDCESEANAFATAVALGQPSAVAATRLAIREESRRHRDEP